MDMRFEHIEQMSSSDRTEFLEAIERDDDLRRDYAAWLALSEHVRAQQDELLSDRSILVLAALHRAGMQQALSDEERNRLDTEWPEVMKGLSDPSFLDAVLQNIADEAADFDRSWDLRQHHLQPLAPRPPRGSGRRRIVRSAWRASAVAAVVVFVGILMFILRRDASWIDIVASAGQTERVALADGSTVRLIGPSVLRYLPSDTGARPQRLRLEGDAFFDVLPAEEPFIVETQVARVAVLGTSFGVRGSPDRTDVVVASGTVAVSGIRSSRQGAVVAAGHACFVTPDQEPSAPSAVNLAEALAWANLFVFRATPLEEIAAVLSRHFDVDVLVDAGLADKTITGTFDSDRDLKDILDVIARTVNAQVVDVPTGYRLVQG